MSYRILAAAGVIASAAALSAPAHAASGTVTNDVNMRTGPSTGYRVITTIPAGAPIEVFGCQGWCQVSYAGREGYVSGSYVSTAYAQYRPAPRVYVEPAPRVYYERRPYWDDYGYWNRPYSHHRHYRHNRPGVGFYFGFGD